VLDSRLPPAGQRRGAGGLPPQDGPGVRGGPAVRGDLRRRGAGGPIFSNQLSFLFYRIEPGLADGGLAEMIGELTRQMMDQVRNCNPQSFLAAMELFKPTPLDFYVSQLGRHTRGKSSTFSSPAAGESCIGMDEFMGARLAGVTHLAPASRPPGLTVVFSRFRGRLGAVLASVDDCLSPHEIDAMEHGLRETLGACRTSRDERLKTLGETPKPDRLLRGEDLP